LQVKPGRGGFTNEDGEHLIERMAARQFVRTIGHDDEQRERRKGTSKIAEQIETGGVSPVEVIKQEEQGALCRHRGEERLELLKQCCLTGNRATAATVGESGRPERKALTRLVRSEEFEPRPVRWRLGEVVAAPDEHESIPLRRLPASSFRKCRFPDACLTTDQHEASVASERCGQPFT
jgi:hypothetical protein